jgi:hypothetical protein
VRKWQRWHWLVGAIACAGLTALLVHAAVHWLTRELPDYSLVEKGLWIGGKVASPPPGTQSVLNLCESDDAYRVLLQKWEPIRDAEPPPDLNWVRTHVEFIQSERAAGRTVFVHCRNGVSRSALVVVAYLMEERDCSRDEALDFLRQRRPLVRPNPAFMGLLLDWERSRVARTGGAESSGEPERRARPPMTEERTHHGDTEVTKGRV